jgi:Predicted ATP-grasp enzyme
MQMPFGMKSRFASAWHILPNDSVGIYEAALLELVKRVQPDVLLPIGMRSVFASVALHDQLSGVTALNVPDREAAAVVNDKSATMASLGELGIPCAQVLSLEDAEVALSREPGLSLVVKPKANVGAARGVRYVKTSAELHEAIDGCRADFGEPFIQEFVPGDPDAMKTVVLLYSGSSQLVAAFTTRKKRQWPPTGGLTAVSKSTFDPSSVEQVKPFFEHWNWKGPAEVEMKLDSVTGVHKVVEINPWFPAYIRFTERCGLDLATTAVRLALSEDVRPFAYPSYKVGVTYVNPALLIRNAGWHLRRTNAAEVLGIAGEFGDGFN